MISNRFLSVFITCCFSRICSGKRFCLKPAHFLYSTPVQLFLSGMIEQTKSMLQDFINSCQSRRRIRIKNRFCKLKMLRDRCKPHRIIFTISILPLYKTPVTDSLDHLMHSLISSHFIKLCMKAVIQRVAVDIFGILFHKLRRNRNELFFFFPGSSADCIQNSLMIQNRLKFLKLFCGTFC